MDDTFAESELFGHIAGAFTDARQPRRGLFASADGGTLFLDEVGKASQHLQQLLLHVVECGEMKPLGSDRVVRIDTRLVAATNTPLDELVEKGRFLDDLRARIAKFRVVLPPLRERRADIPILVSQCLARHAPSCGYQTAPQVHPELMEILERAPWPYNLRELDGTVHLLLIEAGGTPILTPDLCIGDLAPLRQPQKPRPGALHRAEVEAAIADAGGPSKAARRLGVDRTTLHRILKREVPHIENRDD